MYFSFFSSSFGGGLPIMQFSTQSEKMHREKNGKTSNKAKSDTAQGSKQTLLSLFEINVIRYALFLDNTKPENIDPFFMVDFMSLPENYFASNALQKYGMLN